MHKNYKIALYILGVSLLWTRCSVSKLILPASTSVVQRAIPRIELMPNHPQPYRYRDWKQTALEFDRYVFDFNQRGDYLL